MLRSRAIWMAVSLVAASLVAVTPSRAAKLPAGTQLTVRLNSEVVPGDKGHQQFQAELSNSLFVDGHEVLPIGTRIEGDVRGSKKSVVLSPRFLYLPNGARFDFNAAVTAIEGDRLKASEKEGSIEKKGDGGDSARQAAEVGMAGAGVGAMSTGTAKGMGIGAGIGAGAVLLGHKIAGHHGSSAVLPAGTQLTLSLSRPMDLPDAVDQGNAKRSADPDDRPPVIRRDN